MAVHGELFSSRWWIAAAEPDAGDLLICDADGKVPSASLSMACRRRRGLTYLSNPRLTPYAGPWIDEVPGSAVTVRSRQAQATENLVGVLPDVASVRISLAPGADWYPFHAAGFSLSPKQTYAIKNCTDLDAVRAGMSATGRQNLRKGEAATEVRAERSTDALVSLHARTFSRRSMVSPFTVEELERLVVAAESRDRGEVLVAYDNRDRAVAAGFFAWDEETTYYLLGGFDDSEDQVGAMNHVLWRAISSASSRGQMFDFEGSMQPSIARFFRTFGPDPVSYFEASLTSSRILTAGRDIRSWTRSS